MKAEYICAGQPVTLIFRLRQSGGPYILVRPPHSPTHTRDGARPGWTEKLLADRRVAIHVPYPVVSQDSCVGLECRVPGCCAGVPHCSDLPIRAGFAEDAFR